jgi:hypothetical protein
MPIKESSFCSTLPKGMKHGSIMTPETKKAATMWKHPPPLPAKKFKAMPLVRKLKVTVFLDHDTVHVMDFHDCVDTI